MEPSKVSNAVRISQLMFEKQSELDEKLKASYGGKGLKFAATLAGDYIPKDKAAAHDTKRKNDTEGGPPPKKSAMVGSKRFVGNSPSQQSSALPSPAASSSFTSSPTKVVKPSKPAAQGSTPAKGPGQYTLNQEQKDFIKRAKDGNFPIEYDQDNPKNNGSASWDRYELYKTARGVSDFLKFGGKLADLQWDYSRGSVRFPSGGPFASFSSQLQADSAKTPENRPSFSKKSKDEIRVQEGLPRKSMAIPKRVPDPVDYARSQVNEEDTWGISDADRQHAAAKATEGDEAGDGGDDEDDLALEDESGTATLAAARELMTDEQGMYQEALALLASLEPGVNSCGVIARAQRLKAVCRLRTVDPTSLRSLMRSQETPSRDVDRKQRVCVQDELPSRHDHLEAAERPARRDLAKETRSVNEARYEAKGVITLFDARLKEMLDELVDPQEDTACEASSASLSSEVTVQYAFKSELVSFKLHRESVLPAHASGHASGGTRRRKGTGGVASVVSIIEAAAAAERASASASASASPMSDALQSLVNRYSKGGASALTLIAKIGDPRTPSLVASVLALGASPTKSMDGALYLGQKRQDLSWFMSLLYALEPHVAPAVFQGVVCHARATGDTALLVATRRGDTAVARTLLEWGAKVDQENQHCEKRSVRDLADGNAPLQALLLEFSGSEPAAMEDTEC